MCLLSSILLRLFPGEKISPRDIIKRDQISYSNGTITISGIEGDVIIPDIADTNSMDGLFDYGHNLLLLDTFDKSALEIGDIIVYSSTQGLIVHRIVEIGTDTNGCWYKCKGDNNSSKDPYLIRNFNILYLCIGIIY